MPLARTLFRLEVRGAENLPRGGFVLCPNHLSGFDSVALVGAVGLRVLHNMAKVELFENPLLGRLLPRVGGFPARPGDEPGSAVATAATLARGGAAVVVFPEGARRRAGQLHRPRTGAALAAIQAGVPLVPAAITGTDSWRRLGRWQVRFGPPIPLDDLRDLDAAEAAGEATRRLWASVEELRAQSRPSARR